MKWLTLILIPGVLYAQELRFELQPGAFPAIVNGFPAFQPWAGGLDGSTPEFCDLDGDGDLDYFAGSNNLNFWFFDNSGDASIPIFQYASSNFDSLYCLGIGALYQSCIRFCDIDGEGDKDVFTSNGIIGLGINQGNSSQWSFPGPLDTLFDQYGDYMFGIYFDLADVDGDGDQDIIGGFQNPQELGLRFYENVGTPQNLQFNLATIAWQGIQVPQGNQSPCFGDLDGDGDLDLLVGTGAGTVYYYRNDGSLTDPQMTLVTTNYLGIDVLQDASPELADIDGDGDLDLFVGKSAPLAQNIIQGDVYFYSNDGTPQIPHFLYVTSNYLTWDNGRHSEPRLADIDGDGDPDLLSSIGNHLLLYRNTGSLGNPAFDYESSNFGNITVTDLIPWFVDLNGDSLLDLLAGNSAIPGPPGLKLYLNQGTPQAPNWVLYSNDLVPGVFNQGSVLLSPWTADIDADGDQDLFVADDQGRLFLFLNIGTPSNFQFQYVTDNWQNLQINPAGHFFGCFYDIDDDGDMDLFVNDPYDGHLRYYRNDGTPLNPSMILENSNLFPYLGALYATPPFIIDIDQDNDGDLFLGDAFGGCRYFKNITGDTSAVAPPPLHPAASTLRPPVLSIGPNPANPFVVASFELRVASNMSLEVFDLLGRRVAELASGFHLPGEYRYVWDAENSAAGMYIIRLRAGEEKRFEKLVLLK